MSVSKDWMGGLNYFKNILKAISLIENRKIEFVLFFGEDAEKDIIESFKNLGIIITTPLLNKTSAGGFFNTLKIRFFKKNIFAKNIFQKNNIEVVSYSGTYPKKFKFKTINWIPDFQHIHMPWMFSFMENRYRDFLFLMYARYSNAVILSSHDAQNDFIKAYPKYKEKSYVLQFVSQPNEKIYEMTDTKKTEQKYGFSGKFFYLPNQLWKHKNHMVVIRAVNLLKKEGKEILVLCTGHMEDYRNKNFKEEVLKYIKDNNLENNFKFLGLIDYDDVLTLMRHCISIVNSSLFEGWSSTVEEAKSVGKNMILSNLNVHKEQNPPNSIYFDPHNEKELAEKLWNKWQESEGGPDFELEKVARENIEARTKNFGRAYQDIVMSIVGK